MRLYEWLTFAYFLAFGILAWIRPLAASRRVAVTGVAAAGITAIAGLRSTFLRDWLPLAFIPLAYFQSGIFVSPLHEKFQAALESFDRRFVFALPPVVMFVVELAYLFCYPLVPAGLVTLYLTGMGNFAAEFWNVV